MRRIIRAAPASRGAGIDASTPGSAIDEHRDLGNGQDLPRLAAEQQRRDSSF